MQLQRLLQVFTALNGRLALSEARWHLELLAKFNSLDLFESSSTAKQSRWWRYWGNFSRLNVGLFVTQTAYSVYHFRDNFEVKVLNSFIFVSWVISLTIRWLLQSHKQKVGQLLDWCESRHQINLDQLDLAAFEHFDLAAKITFSPAKFGGTLSILFVFVSIFGGSIVLSLIKGSFHTLLLIYLPRFDELNLWTFLLYLMQHGLGAAYLATHVWLFNILLWSFMVYLAAQYKIAHAMLTVIGQQTLTRLRLKWAFLTELGYPKLG